jgi:predicted nucleic acid-binding Zn ribbon protein
MLGKLTVDQIEDTKPKDRGYKLSDGGGLFLYVSPHGAKLWRFGYRFGCKQKEVGFGAFPYVTLAAAQAKLLGARTLLSCGIDPARAKKSLAIIRSFNAPVAPVLTCVVCNRRLPRYAKRRHCSDQCMKARHRAQNQYRRANKRILASAMEQILAEQGISLDQFMKENARAP